MDRTEQLAERHLIFRGHLAPAYEPDGNIPPDFVIDGRIAVEVRRLNQNEPTAQASRGLEEVEVPLIMALERLLDTFGVRTTTTWLVNVNFRRPVPPLKVVIPAARKLLEAVRGGATATSVRTEVVPNVELHVAPFQGGQLNDMFFLGISSDEDSGGWVIDELARNLKICIDTKTAKVAPYRHKYAEWWLLLADQIAYGLSPFDLAQFRSTVALAHTWDKVIVVNPSDPTDYFEL